jgi:hypothetical protein
MEEKVNVYRFSATDKEPKIIVAPDVATAAKHVDFEWDNIKCVYKDVTIAK